MKNPLLVILAIILVTIAFLPQPCYAAFPIRQQQNNSSKQENTRHSFFRIPEHKSKKGGKDMGQTSLILGIVGFFTMPLGIVCSILAIVWGSESLKGENKGLATAGMVLGIIGVVVFLLYLLLILFSVGIFSLM